MNKALTMPRATAGNMGAIVIMAGTVVVVVTPPVVTPPVTTPPVVPPPVTTVCRSWGRKERGGRGGRWGRVRGLELRRAMEANSITE